MIAASITMTYMIIPNPHEHSCLVGNQLAMAVSVLLSDLAFKKCDKMPPKNIPISAKSYHIISDRVTGSKSRAQLKKAPHTMF